MYHHFAVELQRVVCYRLARIRSLTPVHSSKPAGLLPVHKTEHGYRSFHGEVLNLYDRTGDCSKQGGEMENKGNSNKITLEFWYVVYKPCTSFFAS